MGHAFDEALFERALQWTCAQAGDERVLSARHGFEERTGSIEAGDDFEARMAHFFEDWLCDEQHGVSPLEQFAAANDLALSERATLSALLRSHRSLFAFHGYDEHGGVLRDLLGGGRFRFWPGPYDRELRAGDRFDGRLLVHDAGLWLSRGRVFQPRATHAALDLLLDQPAFRVLERAHALDALLRMRSRFQRFESIRAEHVYSLDGVRAAPFAAPWARNPRELR